MAFMQSNNGFNNFNNNGGNGNGERKSFPIGRVYAADAQVDVGYYVSNSATWTTVSVKQSIGTNPSTGSASYEQTHPQQLPSVMLSAEFATAFLDATADDSKTSTLNFKLNLGGPQHSSLTVIGSPSSVKITLAGDRGERSATFEAIPLGDYNSFASWKLLRQYVQAAYKKSLTHKMSAEDAALATGSSNESDDEAPF
jgi:hypothetical protein